jgi:ribosomal protein S12 methylthiotransferase
VSRGRVAFVVLGCAKNQVEAESMSSRLAQDGWELTADIPNASLIVVHTCGFLESARQEAAETLANIRKAAPHSFLVMTGCFAQYLNGKAWPGVDALLGTGQLHRLPEILEKAQGAPSKSQAGPSGYHDPHRPRPLRPGQLSSYLRVSEGCHHRCAFCIIPQLRGDLRSRPVKDVLEEARGLVDRGVRELVLISQDTTDYGRDLSGVTLMDLLTPLTQWPALHWLRVLYAYPAEVKEDFTSLLADEPKLCGYLDMPLQHFSDRILKAMGRDWGQKKTAGLLDRLAQRVPGLALRTTFIVGFPGETDEDFDELERLVREDRFEHVGVFPYSFETRSPSARLPGFVPEEVVKERWDRLLAAHQQVKEKRDRARRGKDIEILVETAPDGSWTARAAHQAPEVDGQVLLDAFPDTPGFYKARVTGTDAIHLTGTLKSVARTAQRAR